MNSRCFKHPICGDWLRPPQGPDTVGFQEAESEKGFLVQVIEGWLRKGSARASASGVWFQLDSQESPGVQSVRSICSAVAVGPTY